MTEDEFKEIIKEAKSIISKGKGGYAEGVCCAISKATKYQDSYLRIVFIRCFKVDRKGFNSAYWLAVTEEPSEENIQIRLEYLDMFESLMLQTEGYKDVRSTYRYLVTRLGYINFNV